jgi:ribosomal protein L11 methyltransferase
MIVGMLLDMDLKGKRVLDCGCGTGILAITALKCGAADAVAYDIDEWSAENTRHNAEINGVADKIEVFEGNANVLSHISGVFDVVLANINRNILIADMPAFKEVMAHGGTLILSGFYEDDVPLLVEEAENLGLKLEEKRENGEWRMLVFR